MHQQASEVFGQNRANILQLSSADDAQRNKLFDDRDKSKDKKLKISISAGR